MGYEDTFRKIKIKDALVTKNLTATTGTITTLTATTATISTFMSTTEVVTGTGTGSQTAGITICVNSGTGANKFTVGLGTGTEGMEKIFKAQISSGSGALITPSGGFYDGTTVTLTDKQWVQFVYTQSKWNIIATNGTVA